nr:chromatin remodeling factor mit1 [Quercus suber]
MSFHFDARADSTSDDDGVDLATWKSGTVSKALTLAQAPARSSLPVAAQTSHTPEKDQSEVTDSNSHQGRKRKRRSPSTAPSTTPARTFQAVNQSTSYASHSPTSDGTSEPAIEELISSIQDAPHAQSTESEQDAADKATSTRKGWVVLPPFTLDRSEYQDFSVEANVVNRIIVEIEQTDGEMCYQVQFNDGDTREVSYIDLLELERGKAALIDYTTNPSVTPTLLPSPQLELPGLSKSSRARMYPIRPGSKRIGRGTRQNQGFVNTVDNVALSDDESEDSDIEATSAAWDKKQRENFLPMDVDDPNEDIDVDNEDPKDFFDRRRRTRKGLRDRVANAGARRTLRSARSLEEDEDDHKTSDSDEFGFLKSDIPGARKRKVLSRSGVTNSKAKRQQQHGMRQSGRATRHQGGMQEVDIDDIFHTDSDDGTRAPAKPKVHSAKEIFKSLPRNDEFRMRHNQDCEVCGYGQNYAPMIYCQGCTLAYHKLCLGHRTNREHLVTKVWDDEFVLQCRRCVAFPRKKDSTAPDQGKCQECHEHGRSCKPFRSRKTPAQEQKDRDDNDGKDPNHDVDASRINNAENVLFRCLICWRGFHFQHLPSRLDVMDLDSEVDAEQRFREYSRDWKCKECLQMPAKVSGIIAWKPVDEDNYDPALSVDKIDEEEKAYLIKWDGMSYFRAAWMPGPWVWGVAAFTTRKAFMKRDDSRYPKMRTEDAIPEDYLRTDIVLDIKFTSIVDIRTEEVDKARIREVDKALIKYRGLGYEDAVWEAPPSPEDGERWTDFVTGYNDWVMGRYVRQPKTALKSRLEKARKEDFSKLEKKVQPDTLSGGELMKYQMEGLNWLYYKWFTQMNAVLADEMGLGKTIQVIGFLATLVKDWNCFPFLVVVPNSTCPNWRREIKRWAPSLRVVAYYGSKESRESAYKYEMYPESCKDLRCHVVITSYDAAADDNCRKFFRSVPWQGMIVDEGQRLKNDKNLLYAALSAMKASFKILLTGTPLQNNTRELFNLLQFLDDNNDAAQLEEEFSDLSQEKITQLHERIRPYFLRRTKAQVLTFLPPMAQIIVPVSMTFVQKRLYRSVLAKNPELMKAIFSPEGALQKTERASLSNILMQLRKCLCHPFVYNKSIEERNVSYSVSHRNLVDASGKLVLLESLLPKLKERGHRVLIFSQFLDMLDIVEDFLEGLQMPYQRLDGSIGTLQKQKRIDEFNAPDSPLFAFLLSTRAGGVGINLATADTVIILDPDFNPHQDIQALSRAHRIGQQKKVLCFQLVTRASAEERIMQMGRKKLALDHVLIQEMDADDDEQIDLVSVLRHGASEIFEDSGEQDIVYDANGVDRLLDRSHIENTRTGEDKTAEVQFSNARVWANDSNALVDADAADMFTTSTGAPIAAESAPDAGVWAKILKERERIAAEEAAAKAEAFGRGRRARGIVDYAGEKGLEGTEGLDMPSFKIDEKKRKTKDGSESDTDFQANESGDDEEPDAGENEPYDTDLQREAHDLDNLRASSQDRMVERNAKYTAGRTKNGKHLSNSSSTPASTPSKSISTVGKKNASFLLSKLSTPSKKASTMTSLGRGKPLKKLPVSLKGTRSSAAMFTNVSTKLEPKRSAAFEKKPLDLSRVNSKSSSTNGIAQQTAKSAVIILKMSSPKPRLPSAVDGMTPESAPLATASIQSTKGPTSSTMVISDYSGQASDDRMKKLAAESDSAARDFNTPVIALAPAAIAPPNRETDIGGSDDDTATI